MLPSPQQQTATVRDPGLDGLRGLAILLVYVFHYGGGLRSPHLLVRLFGYFCQTGWVGVHLFFALSGYLITSLLLRNLDGAGALRNFYMRRVLRIFPVYYGAVAAAWIAATLTGVRAVQLQPLLSYLVFLHNIPPFAAVAVNPPPPLPLYQLWSVAVEEQFYLLWPFLLLWAGVRRRALGLCVAGFALTCAFRAVCFAPSFFGVASAAQLGVFPLTRAGGLALGGALALLVRDGRVSRRWVTSAFAAGALCFLITGWSGRTFLLANSRMYLFGMPGVDIASAALVALSLQPGRFRHLLSNPLLRWFGTISYGFYVLHILLEPVFDWTGRALTQTNTGMAYQTVRLLVALPVSALAAWVSFRCFELPFLRLKRFFPHTPRAAR